MVLSVCLTRKEKNVKTIIVGNRSVSPTKIVCIGRNYLEHIEELNNEVPEEPLFFMKPNSAISEKLHCFHQEPLHFEGEISFLYEDGRFSAVGFGLDLTKRMLQNKLKTKGLPWERCKAFDGSAVFSPFVEIDKVSPTLGLELRINGKIAQSGGVSLMINSPDDILAGISDFMSLENGDVVMTGTPKGVGKIIAGDVFCGKIMDGNTPITSGEWVAG
jgi:2-keto-4-pentenoate hydratase/2-oxohepta-3-ene-1,7-dioic acid hydratase in catechol pathway